MGRLVHCYSLQGKPCLFSLKPHTSCLMCLRWTLIMGGDVFDSFQPCKCSPFPRDSLSSRHCFTALALVSIESAERPNYFLYVHDNGTLSLLMWQANSAFHQRATFFHHQGLWIPGASTFELYSKKGFFIVFSDSSVRVSKYEDSEEFKQSSSFSIEGGLPGRASEPVQTRVLCRPCQMPMLRI